MDKLTATYSIIFDAPKSCEECRFFGMADGYIPLCTIGGGVFGEKTWRSNGNGWYGYDKNRSFECPLTITNGNGKIIYKKHTTKE